MSDVTHTSGREPRGAKLDLSASYEPDDERAARALLLILGLPESEVERIVGELDLESPREM